MSTIRVQTTQNVTVEYETASVGERIVASIIDGVVMGAWVIIVGGIIGSLGGGFESGNAVALGLGIVLVAVPLVFYHLLSETLLNGQSIGKKARDIRVIRLDGTTPHFGDYLLRWVLRIVDTGIGSGIIAVVVVLINGKGQRLGDLAAGTSVVRTRPKPAGGALAPAFTEPGYAVVFPAAGQLADHDVATMRQLLQQGLSESNYELVNELATKVKELTGIRTDLPDEAFLRTILRDHAYLAAQESPHGLGTDGMMG